MSNTEGSTTGRKRSTQERAFKAAFRFAMRVAIRATFEVACVKAGLDKWRHVRVMGLLAREGAPSELSFRPIPQEMGSDSISAAMLRTAHGRRMPKIADDQDDDEDVFGMDGDEYREYLERKKNEKK